MWLSLLWRADALTAPEIATHGFMLDGFPRSIAQAEALDSILKTAGMPVQHVIEIEASEDDLKERVLGRLIHKPSGRSYHTAFKPPKEEMKDDVTGEPLSRRGGGCTLITQIIHPELASRNVLNA